MYDSESGFYYLRSRYYDPFVGRFLNGDTLVATGQGFDGNNMFAYCGNNPVMRSDASGHGWRVAVAIIAGAAINVLGSWLGALITGQEYTWADAGSSALIGAICGIPQYGPYIGGIISGIYTGISNYKDGASQTGAIVSGLIDGAITMVSLGSLDVITDPATKLVTGIVVDASFGTGGTLISSAISESSVQLGNIDITSTSTFSTIADRIYRIHNNSNIRIVNGKPVTINPHMSYVEEDNYNKIYCTVTLP